MLRVDVLGDYFPGVAEFSREIGSQRARLGERLQACTAMVILPQRPRRLLEMRRLLWVAGAAVVVTLGLVGLAAAYVGGVQQQQPDEVTYPAEEIEASNSTSQAPLEEVSEIPVGSLPRVYLGAWVGERVNVPGDVTVFEETIGKGLSIVHRYSDNPPYYGKQFDVSWAEAVRASGSIPMLSWQPGFGNGTRSLASVAAGDRDDYLVTWANQLRDWGHPIFLRMMWEQNATWYLWRAYQEPQISDFIAAWRHVVQVFRSEGAINVTFVWSPHVSDHGASPIMDTYPGDEYVDWVALDGYPFRGGRDDFVDTFGTDYDLLASSLSKPIMIAETSLESWSDELKAERIHDILGQQIPSRFPKVKALVWFDEKNTEGVDFSILQDQGPLSREAFREEVASPYYAANDYATLNTTPIPPPDGPGLPSSSMSRPSTPVRTVETASSNLLVDPGFEEGSTVGEWNQAWVVPPWMSAVVRLDGTSAASGSYSMLQASSRGGSYVVYQDVPVVAGATYEVSVAVRVQERLLNGKAALEVQSLNQYGGLIESRPVAGWQEATQEWSRVGGTIRIAPGAARARVQVRVANLRGSFRLDDFYFARSRG
ncbi:MAG: hypothetical protein EPO21_10840 [Chloroflexota bacterium]|nr:MAG: hypothetical protein EPO21_10840 [Chloroflexota bacterium]